MNFYAITATEDGKTQPCMLYITTLGNQRPRATRSYEQAREDYAWFVARFPGVKYKLIRITL